MSFMFALIAVGIGLIGHKYSTRRKKYVDWQDTAQGYDSYCTGEYAQALQEYRANGTLKKAL